MLCAVTVVTFFQCLRETSLVVELIDLLIDVGLVRRLVEAVVEVLR